MKIFLTTVLTSLTLSASGLPSTYNLPTTNGSMILSNSLGQVNSFSMPAAPLSAQSFNKPNQQKDPKSENQNQTIVQNNSMLNNSSLNSTKIKVSLAEGTSHDVDPAHVALLASKVLQQKGSTLGITRDVNHKMFNNLQALQELLEKGENSPKLKEYYESLLVHCLNTRLKPDFLKTLDSDIPDEKELEDFKNTLMNISCTVPLLSSTTPIINFFFCLAEEFSLSVHLAAKNSTST